MHFFLLADWPPIVFMPSSLLFFLDLDLLTIYLLSWVLVSDFLLDFLVSVVDFYFSIGFVCQVVLIRLSCSV